MGRNPKFSLRVVGDRLSELLKKPVTFLDNCVGETVETACADPPKGSIILLENVRFHIAEEGKGVNPDGDVKCKATDEEVTTFRSSLSKLGDVSVTLPVSETEIVLHC